MEITTRHNSSYIFELTIKSGNVVITEDIAGLNRLIDESEIEQLITVANDMSRFNGTDDVDFVYKIYDALLNDSERERFKELIMVQNQC